MQTYRDLYAVRQFRVVFAANATNVGGTTIQQLALSALVFAGTGSALWAAIAYLAGFAPQALGAMTLISLADRVRPRTFLPLWDCVRAGVALTLALAGLPVWTMLCLVIGVGVGDAVAAAVRQALLVDILGDDLYVLGRSVLNISVGGMQILGYAVGGALLGALGPHVALLGSAMAALVTAGVVAFGLASYPPRATGRAVLSATFAVNRVLFTTPAIRTLLLVQWVPNGLIVGAEALFVPYAGDLAGALFVAAALGMLLGDVIVGRWVSSATRIRLILPLQALLALPYLVFVLEPTVWAGAVAVGLASFGFASSLALQDLYVRAVPANLRGQAMGLVGSGMMTCQALAAALSGWLADLSRAGIAIAVCATLSFAVSLALHPSVRRREPEGRPSLRA
ncbi:MFS transporter [Actinoplanes sp. NPDC048796]|uniref:MFS transporter n=1 Tax=unclassified Actinoplanes TaxID=2626549 RepID=UPI0033C2CBA2